MKFSELNKKARQKAAKDYLIGWQETHPIGEDPIGDLTIEEAYDCCIDINDEIEYDENGNELGETCILCDGDGYYKTSMSKELQDCHICEGNGYINEND